MKKHIVISLDQIVLGGVETVLLTLLEGLLETRKYEISLVLTHYLEESFFIDAFRVNNIRVVSPAFLRSKPRNICIKLLWKLKRGYLKWRYRWNRRMLLKQADILIDFKNGALDPVLKKIYNKPKLMWIHGSFLFVQNQMNVDFSHYKKVICLTDSLCSKMQQRYPALHNTFQRIYNLFDIESIRAHGVELNRLSPKNLALISEPYFLHIGRLHPDKDIETLINAYEQFLTITHSSIKLYLLGTGGLFAHYHEIVEQKNLSDKIIFLGVHYNPHVWTKRAKALVLSSPSEGLPCVLIESMILGTLTIASDCPDGPAEILEHGKCGVLFEPGNVGQLAQILVDVEEGRLSADQFSVHVESSLERFDKYNIQQQVNTLIEDCLTLNNR